MIFNAFPNVRFPPVADIEKSLHLGSMKCLIVIVLSLALCSCTRSFEISVTFRGESPVFDFHRTGLFSSRQMEACVWIAEIIDERTERAVFRLTPTVPDECRRVSRLDVGALPRGSFRTSIREPLKPVTAYRMEVTAQEGVGRSEAWSLPEKA